MSAENECIVYTGGLKKLEVLERTKLARIVNDLPLTDKFASISLNPGGSFETLNFITETAVFKVSSETISAGTLHKIELQADFSGMETFSVIHKLLIREWVLKITDNKDIIWLFGSPSKAGRFKRILDSKNSGILNSGTILSYTHSSAISPLKST